MQSVASALSNNHMSFKTLGSLAHTTAKAGEHRDDAHVCIRMPVDRGDVGLRRHPRPLLRAGSAPDSQPGSSKNSPTTTMQRN